MKQSKRGGLVLSLFVIWLAALFRITVLRDGCFSHGLCSGRVEWIPFLYLAKLLRIGYYRYFCYLFFGNLIWLSRQPCCVCWAYPACAPSASHSPSRSSLRRCSICWALA